MISALGEVKDISASGLCVIKQGELPVSVGTQFQLEVKLGQRLALLPAELVQAESLDDNRVELGIAFRELTEGQTRQLAGILDRLDAPHDLEVHHTPETEAAEDAIDTAETILSDMERNAESLQGVDNVDEAQRTWREALTGYSHGYRDQDRRKHGRLAAQDAKSSLGVVMDISGSGLRIRRKGSPAVRVGETFMIELNAAGRVLRAPVRVINIRKVGWRSYDYGLAFGHIPEEIRGEFSQLARMASKAVEIH